MPRPNSEPATQSPPTPASMVPASSPTVSPLNKLNHFLTTPIVSAYSTSKTMTLQYFGTDLNQAGHGFNTLDGNQMYRSRLSFNDCPFNPEGLPYVSGTRIPSNGTAKFYQFAGFSIYAIAGSCYDSRPGSKSIFFIEKQMNAKEMKELIMSTPIAVKIIQKMPFAVEW